MTPRLIFNCYEFLLVCLFPFNMLVVILLFLTISLCRSQEITENNDTILTSCIQNAILHNFQKGSEITYVDLNYPYNEILKNIHDLNFVTLVSRKTDKRINQYNEAYFIMVDNFDTFKVKFGNLTKEKDWNPKVHFLVVFKEIDTELLTDLFNIFLHYHVFEVAVMDSIGKVQVYTYNPFGDYGCGKSFTKVINLGGCSATNISNLYFYKFTTGLQRCTFNAVISHWPPYTINPEKNLGPVKLTGTEQYIIQMLSELEGFNINYTYTYKAEEFSLVNDDMEASGQLSLIQNENVDMILGGMLLTSRRAEAFDYFCGHHAFTDKLNIVVKKTGPVPNWKNIYLEFNYIIWILVVITFFIFFLALVVLFRLKNKCSILFIMWAVLFQQSRRLYYKFKVKCFIFQWVFFVFLINIYYQSNLMGLTTHVSHNYQVSNEKDLVDYKLQSCVSSVIKEVVRLSTGTEYDNAFGKHCDTVMDSLDTVSKDDTKYTVMLFSIFNYNKLKYTDNFGDTLLYVFKVPIYKIIYGVYFYKGFPMLQHLHGHTLRMRENGLINKRMDELYYENTRKVFFAKKQFQTRFIFPVCILIIGTVLSAASLIVELIVDHTKRRRMNRIIYLH